VKGLLVRAGKYIRQPWRLSVFLKRLGLIALFFALACVVYYWSIRNVSAGRDVILSVILIWLATAYYLLPRIHRLLSRMYVPNYFIGRARTADGLLADPVNLAVRGNLTQLKKAMQKAGWEVADPITLRSSWGIFKATLRRRSYETAPVSDMYVFGQKQQIAFQKEVDGNPAKRHHVRFWQVPRGMYLPGGYKVNWVGGATYDDAVGLSLFTLQITHRIDGDVDAERNFVVQTLESAKTVEDVQKIEHFFPKYSHHNGINGSKFFTDGSMIIVDLKRVEK
jgi:hypothetical protein